MTLQEVLASYCERYKTYDGFMVLRCGHTEKFFILLEPVAVEKIYIDEESEIQQIHKRIQKFLSGLALFDRSIPEHVPVVAGYFGYEFLHALEKIPFTACSTIPTVALYKYKTVIECSETDQITHHFPTNEDSLWKGQNELGAPHPEKKENTKTNLLSSRSKDEYCLQIDTIQDAIREGDVYQVNLSRKISAPSHVTVEEGLKFLCENPAARYGAFGTIHAKDSFSFLSLSPELFFRRTGSDVVTEPIKGTTSKTGNFVSDQGKLAALVESAKDLAELAMIVDLFRNDLGKFAKPTSVHVGTFPTWFETDSLYHLCCRISCEVSPETSSYKILCDLFPSGSITGTPKIAAMEYIAHLEQAPRGIYCGSIGYFGTNQSAQWNVAIRTIVIQESIWTYGTGGGVTIESDSHSEFDETEAKAKIFYKLIGHLA